MGDRLYKHRAIKTTCYPLSTSLFFFPPPFLLSFSFFFFSPFLSLSFHSWDPFILTQKTPKTGTSVFQQINRSCKFLSKHNKQEKQTCLQKWDVKLNSAKAKRASCLKFTHGRQDSSICSAPEETSLQLSSSGDVRTCFSAHSWVRPSPGTGGRSSLWFLIFPLNTSQSLDDSKKTLSWFC